MTTPKLTIVRGLPGSGKTTIAENLASATGAVYLDPDQWFTDDEGNYEFKPDLAPLAHLRTLNSMNQHLERGDSVVLTNVFTACGELSPYISVAQMYVDLKKDLRIINVSHASWGQDVHEVPIDVYRAMEAESRMADVITPDKLITYWRIWKW